MSFHLVHTSSTMTLRHAPCNFMSMLGRDYSLWPLAPSLPCPASSTRLCNSCRTHYAGWWRLKMSTRSRGNQPWCSSSWPGKVTILLIACVSYKRCSSATACVIHRSMRKGKRAAVKCMLWVSRLNQELLYFPRFPEGLIQKQFFSRFVPIKVMYMF